MQEPPAEERGIGQNNDFRRFLAFFRQIYVGNRPNFFESTF